MTASAGDALADAVADRRRRKRERRVRWAVSLGLVVFRALARTWRFRLLADDPSCAAGRETRVGRRPTTIRSTSVTFRDSRTRPLGR